MTELFVRDREKLEIESSRDRVHRTLFSNIFTSGAPYGFLCVKSVLLERHMRRITVLLQPNLQPCYTKPGISNIVQKSAHNR